MTSLYNFAIYAIAPYACIVMHVLQLTLICCDAKCWLLTMPWPVLLSVWIVLLCAAVSASNVWCFWILAFGGQRDKKISPNLLADGACACTSSRLPKTLRFQVQNQTTPPLSLYPPAALTTRIILYYAHPISLTWRFVLSLYASADTTLIFSTTHASSSSASLRNC